MESFVIKALNNHTWSDFAKLVEKNNGVWGGCWCMSFHEEGVGKHRTVEQNRREKECRVHEDRAHAAIVYLENEAVGWCQFGKPEELPKIKMKKEYEQKIKDNPDWRITCFFVDKGHRHLGISSIALDGALSEIAKQGGGIVESYPEDVEKRKVSGSFLYNSILSMFEGKGFKRVEKLGKNHWIVRKRVDTI